MPFVGMPFAPFKDKNMHCSQQTHFSSSYSDLAQSTTMAKHQTIICFSAQNGSSVHSRWSKGLLVCSFSALGIPRRNVVGDSCLSALHNILKAPRCGTGPNYPSQGPPHPPIAFPQATALPSPPSPSLFPPTPWLFCAMLWEGATQAGVGQGS